MSAIRLFLLLFVAGIVLPVPRAAFADVKKGDEERRRLPAPLARSTQVRAVRGQPVEIPLEGVTSTTRTLRFIIRRGPRLGTLDPEPLRMEGKMKAFFRYTPRPGETETQDTFTFATQVEGSPASAEAMVTIFITDPAFNIMTAPASVNAGRFVTTEGAEIEFSVRNTGDAPFRQTVAPPEGWLWLRPRGGRFELEPGEGVVAQMRVATRQPGGVDQRLALGNAELRVSGEAIPPFLAYPSEVRASWDAGARRRAASFTIQNNTSRELPVEFTVPQGFSLPKSVTVPAQGKTELELEISARPEQSAAGEILLGVEGHTQALKAQANPAPASLVFEGLGDDGLVDFGKLDAETLPAAQRVLKIKNEGGTEASVLSNGGLELFQLEGFTQGGFTLPPGGEVELKVSPVRNMPGVLREEWKLLFAGGEKSVVFKAEVDQAAVNAPARPAPLSRATQDMTSLTEDLELTPKQKTTLVAALHHGVVELDSTFDPSLPVVTSTQIIKEEPTRLVFAWNPPGPGKWTYKVWAAQLRKLPNNPFPIKQFGPMDNVKVTWENSVGQAEVTNLPPGGMFKCRIIAVNEEGRSSLPGPELTFMTPYEKPFPWGWAALWTFFAVSFFVWWRARKRERGAAWSY